jgi:hypothetical protein
MKAVIVCSGSIEDYDYHRKFFDGNPMVNVLTEGQGSYKSRFLLML